MRSSEVQVGGRFQKSSSKNLFVLNSDSCTCLLLSVVTFAVRSLWKGNLNLRVFGIWRREVSDEKIEELGWEYGVQAQDMPSTLVFLPWPLNRPPSFWLPHLCKYQWARVVH